MATLFQQAGVDPREYNDDDTAIRESFWDEIGLGFGDDKDTKEDEDEEPDTQAFYRQLSQAEVDKIKCDFYINPIANRLRSDRAAIVMRL
jgi:hypothetical protein